MIIALTLALFQSTAADVPYSLRNREGSGTIRQAYQAGKVRCVTPDKLVVIDWTSSAIVNSAPNWSLVWDPQTNALGTHLAQHGSQSFPVRFFPTAAAAAGPTQLVVGGLTAAGKTVVEVWSIQWPSPMSAPSVNISTGLSSVGVTLPSITQVNRVYDAAAGGKLLVRNLCAVRTTSGTPDACLVQFDDSSDVYKMTLATGSLALVASPTSSSGTAGLVLSLQSANHFDIAAADHSVAGYTYTFIRGGKLPAAPSALNPAIVVLVDGNRDGTIESALQLSSNDYYSQGWSVLENYNSWWLN